MVYPLALAGKAILALGVLLDGVVIVFFVAWLWRRWQERGR